MQKIDFKKELKHLYRQSAKKAALVEVPQMNFLMIDGQGDPNTSPIFQNAVEALFGVAYTLKFMVKKGEIGIDYGVLPLEGLWWVEDMSKFDVEKKEDWQWTLMIMQPEMITADMVKDAIAQKKKKADLPALADLRFSTFAEGRAAQIMHVGPFSTEGPTVKGLHQFIDDSGLRLSGKHHEIYLSDIRRAAPEKWKTIIRQPVA